MAEILVVVADQLQLDRRVLHQSLSLARVGHSVRLLSLVPGMARPVELGPGVRFLDAGDDGRAQPGGVTGAVAAKGHLYRILTALVPRTTLEVLYYGLIDPAESRAARFGGVDVGAPPDLIIGHDVPQLVLLLRLKDRFPGAKVILDAHELYEEQWDSLRSTYGRRYWTRLQQRYLARCDGVMTVTPRLASELAARYHLPARPTVLLNACPYTDRPAERGALHRLYGIPEDRPVVLCQGGLTPGRNLEELVQSWAYLARPRPALAFLGFGVEPVVSALRATIRRLSLTDDVFVGKAVPPDQVLRFTTDASLGLISNRGEGLNNTDGAPNRLFEYLQARVPVLAYEHRGVRQVLSATGTGWVVGWRSPQELAQLVARALEDARGLPPATLDRAAREFSWEVEEPKFLELVGGLLGSST